MKKSYTTKLQKFLLSNIERTKENTQTLKHQNMPECDEALLSKCQSAKNMVSALNSVCEEGLHDNK